MFDKQSIIKEIYQPKEFVKECLVTRFKDDESEKEFNEFNRYIITRLSLTFGLSTLVYQFGNVFFFINYYDNFKSTFFTYLVHSLVNLVFFLKLLSIRPGSKLYLTITYIRYFINVFRNFHYLIFLLSFERQNRATSVVRNFYLHSVCSKGEYLFFMKNTPVIPLFSEIAVFLIMLYGTLYVENDILAYSPELISCFPGFLMTLGSIYFTDFKLQNFFSFKKIEAILLYFEGLLNSMDSQLVSFSDYRAYYFNTSFKAAYANLTSNNPTHPSKNLNCSEYEILKKSGEDHFGNDQSELSEDFKIMKYLSSFYQQSETGEIHNRHQNPVTLKSVIQEQSSSLQTSNSIFLYLGSFTNSTSSRFYKVFYRKFEMESKSIIIDLLINEITKVKEAEMIRVETQLKQRLFSKFAHEFKTPLLIIKSLLSDLMIEMHTKNASFLEKRSMEISYLSEYIHFLINDIIYYADKDSMSIYKDYIDPKSILVFCQHVADALLAVMPGIRDKIETLVVFDDELLFYNVTSDSARIKQVLLNLISNSVKFTKKGQIKIEAKLIDKEKGIMQFSVTDTGIGMNKDDIDRIIQSSDKPLKISIGNPYNQMGTGIGIGIVKSIVHKLGHGFEVISEKMVGTSIKISINDIKPNELFNHMLSERETIREEPAFNSGNLRKLVKNFIPNIRSVPPLDKNSNWDNIDSFELEKQKDDQISLEKIYDPSTKYQSAIIIADDCSSLRKSVLSIFKKCGLYDDYYFIECADGIDILKIMMDSQINRATIKMIVTDESMEYLNGSMAIKLIRNLESQNKFNKVFIVSLTAFVDEATVSNIKSMGSNLVLVKPLNKESMPSLYQAFHLYIGNEVP